MRVPPRHTYRVKEVKDAPRCSHGGFLFPVCLYTLLRQDDQETVQVILPKTRRWKAGDLVEVDDWTIVMARG